jgi:hypothetical protein
MFTAPSENLSSADESQGVSLCQPTGEAVGVDEVTQPRSQQVDRADVDRTANVTPHIRPEST